MKRGKPASKTELPAVEGAAAFVSWSKSVLDNVLASGVVEGTAIGAAALGAGPALLAIAAIIIPLKYKLQKEDREANAEQAEKLGEMLDGLTRMSDQFKWTEENYLNGVADFDEWMDLVPNSPAMPFLKIFRQLLLVRESTDEHANEARQLIASINERLDETKAEIVKACSIAEENQSEKLSEHKEYLDDLRKVASKILEFQNELPHELQGQFEALKDALSNELRSELDGFRQWMEKAYPNPYPPTLVIPSNSEVSQNFSFELLEADCQRASFYGREEELRELLEWLNDSKGFSWWGLRGAVGVGKSRLALELCKRLKDIDWDAGFLVSGDRWMTEPESVKGWSPRKPTLIVIDDAGRSGNRVSLFKTIFELYHRWENEGSLPRVRLLLIDRPFVLGSLYQIEKVDPKVINAAKNSCYLTLPKIPKLHAYLPSLDQTYWTDPLLLEEMSSEIPEDSFYPLEELPLEYRRKIVADFLGDSEKYFDPDSNDESVIAVLKPLLHQNLKDLQVSGHFMATKESVEFPAEINRYADYCLHQELVRNHSIWEKATGLSFSSESHFRLRRAVSLATLLDGINLISQSVREEVLSIIGTDEEVEVCLDNWEQLSGVRRYTFPPLAPRLLAGYFLLQGGVSREFAKNNRLNLPKRFNAREWLPFAMTVSVNNCLKTVSSTLSDFPGHEDWAAWLDSTMQAGSNLNNEKQKEEFFETWTKVLPEILAARLLSFPDSDHMEEILFTLSPLSRLRQISALCKLRENLSQLRNSSFKIPPLILDKIFEFVIDSQLDTDDLSPTGILNLSPATILNEGESLAHQWIGLLKKFKEEGGTGLERLFLKGIFNVANVCGLRGWHDLFEQCMSQVETMTNIGDLSFHNEVRAMFYSAASGFYARDSKLEALELILEKVGAIADEDHSQDEILQRVVKVYYNSLNAQWASSSRRDELLEKLLDVSKKVPLHSPSQQVAIWALTRGIERNAFMKSQYSSRLKEILIENLNDEPVLGEMVKIEVDWLISEIEGGSSTLTKETEFEEKIYLRLENWLGFEESERILLIKKLIADCVAASKRGAEEDP